MYFHVNLQKYREEKGITQLRLARLSGVSQAFISQIESGERVPNVYIAEKLALALGKTLDDMMGGGDDDA